MRLRTRQAGARVAVSPAAALHPAGEGARRRRLTRDGAAGTTGGLLKGQPAAQVGEVELAGGRASPRGWRARADWRCRWCRPAPTGAKALARSGDGVRRPPRPPSRHPGARRSATAGCSDTAPPCATADPEASPRAARPHPSRGENGVSRAGNPDESGSRLTHQAGSDQPQHDAAGHAGVHPGAAPPARRPPPDASAGMASSTRNDVGSSESLTLRSGLTGVGQLADQPHLFDHL